MKDRGTKKWTSLMLPEHVEMLQHFFVETTYEKKPLLDEQQKAIINRKLLDALHTNRRVNITIYENNGFQQVSGQLLHIDNWNRCVCIRHAKKENVPFVIMIDVEII